MSIEHLEPGWYEFHTTNALTSIAYVQERGDVFVPDPEFSAEDFLRSKRIHHLVREPRTITTVEEVDALHQSAILRSRRGDAFQRGEDFHQRKGWFMNGTVDPLTTKQIVPFGPFTVIHDPS